MRPKFTLRARRAATALGALCTITTVAVLPAAAQTARPAARTSATPATVPAATAESTATGRAASATPAAIAATARRLDVVAGSRARVRGHLVPALGGRRVSLQRRSRGGGWHTVDRGMTNAHGAFKLAFRPRRPGSAALRVRAGAAERRVGRLNVYRSAMVSWYGPGLYGNALGCGGTLTPSTLGVANKSLPCGTRLTLRHGSRRVRVRVVDRGPYVAGREFDLTSATRARLGFDGVGTILVNR